MPARSRSAKQNSNGDVDLKHDQKYRVEQVGVYGWRKRCLYVLIMLIVVMAMVNLALIIWILRVQNFNLDGMGSLHITNDGIRMEGVAEFMAALRAKRILSRQDTPLKINSRRNISLSTLDEHNNVLGQVTLSSTQIVLKNKELVIQDHNGRTLMYADDKRLTLNMDDIKLTVPGGLNFENSVQTPVVKSSDGAQDLRLESLTKKLYLNAANGVKISSHVNNIVFTSLKDTIIQSKKGKLLLDASNIMLKNIKQSSVPEPPVDPEDTVSGTVYGGIAEVCVCGNGKLFLAPPDIQKPCKVTAGVCG